LLACLGICTMQYAWSDSYHFKLMLGRWTFETLSFGLGPCLNELRNVTRGLYSLCPDAYSMPVLQGCLSVYMIISLTKLYQPNKVVSWHLSCDRTKDHKISSWHCGIGTCTDLSCQQQLAGVCNDSLDLLCTRNLCLTTNMWLRMPI